MQETEAIDNYIRSHIDEREHAQLFGGEMLGGGCACAGGIAAA